MTRSEAKAIQARCGEAYRALVGTEAEKRIPYTEMAEDLRERVWASVQHAAEEVKHVLDMALAELDK